ncbi:MAG: aminotransferase class I/II-fold pyridoxal phosphate-dependent enzyme, partial [Clostridia bacterium]|nr:aminotransferase class I/II-fold pyridoxal phosphate-dependent enzyme [Clostridia bacterium]
FGLPEARRFFSDYTGVPAENIIVCGNSSLNLMYDAIMRCLVLGTVGSPRPWCREEKLKFLCPAPGYDRHFAVTESLGFELIPVKMTETGPDMDAVEALVADPAVKGIWCVPKYSNPTGITYSEETVRRLVSIQTAAPDFRIFWDNAYAIHAFGEEDDTLADVFALAKAAGNEDRVFYFTSTSKVTLPGAGISMIAASERNLVGIRAAMSVQTIGHDKLNQLRHVRLFQEKGALHERMLAHGRVIGRKFCLLLSVLERDLAGLGIATWTKPRGGYFSSLDVLPGCATRVYQLCAAAGVALTKVGATFPYGKDPEDKNLRLAPTFAGDEALTKAASVLTVAVRMAAAEKLLGE